MLGTVVEQHGTCWLDLAADLIIAKTCMVKVRVYQHYLVLFTKNDLMQVRTVDKCHQYGQLTMLLLCSKNLHNIGVLQLPVTNEMSFAAE